MATMARFKFGALVIDAVAFASQGNAVLGIRDSGKTYTATMLAERLHDAGIPFIAFDPVGVWKFLRVPGKGRGYPVVVAGGKDGDLPLTVHGAPEIVRAAMRNGVSLVIDLFDINLSKGDWRRIVTSCVRVLLHENQPHGLRHIFIEEAAEFVPQRPFDTEVYAEVEKLARMGGNSRLGYTLINQRSQEVSKAVLELCENLFLHRQRGKNALENLTKWLDVADVARGRDIIKSLFDLPTGQCWAWMGGTNPTLIKVPQKNSFHPDRRVMRGDNEAVVKKAVDVGAFVDKMKSTLVSVEQQAKDNDPKLLKQEIARLKTELAKGGPDRDAIIKAEGRAKIAGYSAGIADALAELKKIEAGTAAFADTLQTLLKTIRLAVQASEALAKRPPVAAPAPVIQKADRHYREKPKVHEDDLPRPQRRVINSLGFWKNVGIDTPSREQVAGVAGYAPGSGGVNNLFSAMHSADLIGYPHPGSIALTAAGAAHLNGNMGVLEAKAMLYRILKEPQRRVVEAAMGKGVISRDDLALASNYAPGSGGFNNLVSSLRTLAIFDKRRDGMVALTEWARGILE